MGRVFGSLARAGKVKNYNTPRIPKWRAPKPFEGIPSTQTGGPKRKPTGRAKMRRRANKALNGDPRNNPSNKKGPPLPQRLNSDRLQFQGSWDHWKAAGAWCYSQPRKTRVYSAPKWSAPNSHANRRHGVPIPPREHSSCKPTHTPFTTRRKKDLICRQEQHIDLTGEVVITVLGLYCQRAEESWVEISDMTGPNNPQPNRRKLLRKRQRNGRLKARLMDLHYSADSLPTHFPEGELVPDRVTRHRRAMIERRKQKKLLKMGGDWEESDEGCDGDDERAEGSP
eukprot:TRINITY_DN68144_c7_g1_i1.p1 TRINITY_DN68144_c7_g1~~TRINITY_DN68144_c7_g1_i1.p1  ORF type:complete len:283 (-),score=1.20 TRINITY_DN68144_c7_g1_i1:88-936(-)